MPQNTTPLYAEGVHMLVGLVEEEVDDFLEDHPTIIPLFEMDVILAIGSPPAEDVTEDSLPQVEPIPQLSRSYAKLVTRLNENSPSPSESKHLLAF